LAVSERQVLQEPLLLEEVRRHCQKKESKPRQDEIRQSLPVLLHFQDAGQLQA
jgi:hypothetical protein